MLHSAASPVARPRFPVLEFHAHLTWSGEQTGQDKITFNSTPEELLAVMDRKGVRTMVNLTGGYGNGLRKAISRLQDAHPGRFLSSPNPAGAE